MARPLKDPGLAAVLSLVIPGIGQFYNGDFLRGLFWLIITPDSGSARAVCSAGCVTSLRP